MPLPPISESLMPDQAAPTPVDPRSGYLLAALLAGAALILRQALTPVLGNDLPYLLSLLAITTSAVIAGERPALLATLLSAAGINFLVTQPRFRFTLVLSLSESVGLLLFLLVGIGISWLGGKHLATLQQARAGAQALREREAQLRALTDNLPGAMTYQAERLPGGTTRFLYVSGSVQRLLGVSPAQVYSDSGELYGLILPEYLPAVLEAEERAVRLGTTFEIEVPMRLADGNRRWMHLASSLRRLPNGRELWDGVAFNVTERREAQEALQALNTALEERVAERTEQLVRSNQELEQFAYVASHDLKAPLRTITSFLQLLERRYGDQLDERATTYIQHVVEAAARMNLLIDDLLAYARLGRERKVGRVEPEKVLQDVLNNLHSLIEERGARVEAGLLPPVQTDETQLRQVLQNLVGNGLKFQPPDRVPEVQVRAERQGDRVRFAVQDNGIGIEPEYHERIFGVFQRLHTRSQYAGSGVGLAIVKRIVEEDGGHIELHSIPTEGTTFFFTLPAADGPTS
ncbi:sensor histidine kinase [Deinococcus hopiensis]|uniref:histidine kinase n=1 Tax=Deinococcus hopiensis KR-140 TaxID=695939 RepID=A0A1W1VHB2_9DEIO|nr:PAS domain-containing sensor histidine kinase [Deinococcus hopiensis]SMB92633.1 PAS domain S-box-containing protein [Deinococcus hopiensis KR-140]